MKADADDLSQARDVGGARELSETEIDDILKDTFPASDPPSWTLGSDYHRAVNRDSEDDAE
jgi:hypothetical protein